MTIYGDLIELPEDDSIAPPEEQDLEKIPWEFHEGIKIHPETLSLYSIDSANVEITELKTEVFNAIEKSSFSNVYAHIYPYDELFILFFEFAIEKDVDQFEFSHFGIVPASDFFNALKENHVIKIRHKQFRLTKNSQEKILEKVNEFKSKFPKNSLL